MIIPIFRIFDETRAKEFYLGFLGFTLDWEHRFAPGMPLYCQVSHGAVRLHLSEHHGDACPGASARISCGDLDAYGTALNAKGYKYYRPGIEEQPWGRDMTVQDPFGNRLIFFAVET